MRTVNLVAGIFSLLLLVIGLSCGESRNGSSPRGGFELAREAANKKDWGSLYRMLCASSRGFFETRWRENREIWDKMSAEDRRSQSMKGYEWMGTCNSGQDYFVKMVETKDHSTFWVASLDGEFVSEDVQGGHAALKIQVDFDGNKALQTLEMVREQDCWLLDIIGK